MHRLFFAALLPVLAVSNPASAETSAVQTFVAAVNGGNVEGCMASFAEGTRFIDLGNDFSAPDKLSWLCNEVVKQKANYKILTEQQSGNQIDWTFDFKAGGYFLEGKGKALIDNGKFKELVIERR